MAFNKHKTPRLVYGVGINDASYPIAKRVNGKQVMCPVYTTWKGMLDRCYGPKADGRNKAYIGCSVVPEWLRFSGFEKWLMEQPKIWEQENYELDKDLLTEGNKVYGPETCLFVPKVVNNFFTQKFDENIGVTYFPNRKKPWRAKCGAGSRNDKWIGYFATKTEAQDAYLQEKVKRGEEIASTLTEQRVRTAFLNRLETYKEKIMNLA